MQLKVFDKKTNKEVWIEAFSKKTNNVEIYYPLYQIDHRYLFEPIIEIKRKDENN